MAKIFKKAMLRLMAFSFAALPMGTAFASTPSPNNVGKANLNFITNGTSSKYSFDNTLYPNGEIKTFAIDNYSFQRVNQGFTQVYAANGSSPDQYYLVSASERLSQGIASVKVVGDHAVIYLMPNDYKHFNDAVKTSMISQLTNDMQLARTGYKEAMQPGEFPKYNLTYSVNILRGSVGVTPIHKLMPSKVSPAVASSAQRAEYSSLMESGSFVTNFSVNGVTVNLPNTISPQDQQGVSNPIAGTPQSSASSGSSVQNLPASWKTILDRVLATFTVGAFLIGAAVSGIRASVSARIAESRKAKEVRLRVVSRTVAEKHNVIHVFDRPKPVLLIAHEPQLSAAMAVKEAFTHASKVFAEWKKPNANKPAATTAMNNALGTVEKSLVAMAATSPTSSAEAEILCSVARYAARKNETVKGIKFEANDKTVLLNIIEANADKIENEKLRGQMKKFVQARRPSVKTAAKSEILAAA